MVNAHQKVIAKVQAIFKELAGSCADQLDGSVLPKEAQKAICKALRREHGVDVATKIAFHLTDWNADAAFMVALMLFPKRFTPREIAIGIELFLIHAPGHVMAAAKIADWY